MSWVCITRTNGYYSNIWRIAQHWLEHKDKWYDTWPNEVNPPMPHRLIIILNIFNYNAGFNLNLLPCGCCLKLNIICIFSFRLFWWIEVNFFILVVIYLRMTFTSRIPSWQQSCKKIFFPFCVLCINF